MSSIKHRVKTALVEAWARLAWHTPLGRFVDASSERRLLILYGHCVDDPELNGELHPDMKIGASELSGFLRVLGERFDLVTISEGMKRLQSGVPGRSMVALSMDDGYRDNWLRLVPLLDSLGAKATVFLEAGAVAERQLPWLHALGWLDGKLGPKALGARLADSLPDVRDALLACDDSGRLKRILKYDAGPHARDRALAALVEEEGGDPREIVDRLYLSVNEARRLSASDCIEIGGHTVHHPVLSRLNGTEQLTEIAGGAVGLCRILPEAETGLVLAYPYGRSWDFNRDSMEAAKRAGYSYAVTTHDGVNLRGAEPFALKRVPIHGGSKMHLLWAEATGCLELFRRGS